MTRKLGLAVLFLVLDSLTAFAADFNGKWTAGVQGRMGTQSNSPAGSAAVRARIS